MKRLNQAQAIMLHALLIEKTGGISGIRDKGILDSALVSPFQSFGGEDLYPEVECKAARLCYAMIKNHPFLDGNKRIGVLAMLVFLRINEINLDFTDEELASLGWGSADGSVSYNKILELLKEKV